MSTPPPPPSPYTPPGSGSSIPAGPDSAPRLPWEERDRLGLVEAFVQTVRLLFIDTKVAFSRLRRDGDLTSPMLFGILVSWVSVLLSQLWNMLFLGSMSNIFGGVEGLEEAFQAPSLFELVVTLIIWPFVYVVIVFLGSGVLHLCLLIVGATERSETGFEGTLKVYAYATVAWLAVVLPFVGGLIAWLWNIVLEVVGLAAVHRTSQGRALAAVLIPTMVCCLCGLLLMILFGAAIAGFMQQLGGEL